MENKIEEMNITENEEQLATLYKQFENEDKMLVNEGMQEYLSGLQREDKL